MGAPQEDIQALLLAWSHGDHEALGGLTPLVYSEVRTIARAAKRGDNPNNSLQTTVLVNEAYIRVHEGNVPSIDVPGQFYGFVAKVIRRILLDAARKRDSQKRGGGWDRVPLEEAMNTPSQRSGLTPEMTIALDGALDQLWKEAPRQAEIVELHFFVGLTHPEMAKLLGRGKSTVRGQWAAARKFLALELSPRE